MYKRQSRSKENDRAELASDEEGGDAEQAGDSDTDAEEGDDDEGDVIIIRK